KTIAEIVNNNEDTNEEKGKKIGRVSAAYEEGLNNINAASTTGDVTTAKDTAGQKDPKISSKYSEETSREKRIR
ncbi:hypothetical protein FE74_15060, partial [Staphylococcus aureus]